MKAACREWLLCLICGFAWLAPALAADYPSRAIRFIVPFPPGGGTDTMARAIGTRLGDALGEQIVVDNRGGGGAEGGGQGERRQGGGNPAFHGHSSSWFVFRPARDRGRSPGPCHDW